MALPAFSKKHLLLIILSMILYYHMSYVLIRGNFAILLLNYTALFLCFLAFIRSSLNEKSLLSLSILFRILLLFSIPNLSQDFYRFIWDGRMLINGFNPYLYLPQHYLNPDYVCPNEAAALVKGMQELNASHYSNYPPLNQLCFAIATLVSPSSILGAVITLKLLLLFADIGIYHFGRKLLQQLNLNKNLIFLYLLNPLVILEVNANLHFEGVMVFFIIWSIYLLHKNQLIKAAIIFACSISLKLLPLLFLPLLFKQLSLKKLITFYSITGATVLLTFTPFISQALIENYSNTVGLWFGNFEFNAGLQNLLKHGLIEFGGYSNWSSVRLLGKIMPVLVLIFVLILSFKRKDQSTSKLFLLMLFSLSFYLFTASTVHPWYVVTLVGLSIFTPYRFPILWSFTIILSYSFYLNESFITNYWLIGIEYILVLAFMFYELKKAPKIDAFSSTVTEKTYLK